ncbi:anti-sigma factor [Patescibacteria group bacterium]
MKKIIGIAGLLFALLVIGVYFANPFQKDEAEIKTTVEPTINEPNPSLPIEESAKTEDKAINDPQSISTPLKDLSGQGRLATAYLVRTSNKLYHYVIADLPDPPEGSAYEGWLVNNDPKLSFFSTGVMEKTLSGKYELAYMAGQSYEGYNKVVITLETKVDETPEKHILEGAFPQQIQPDVIFSEP